MNIRGQRQKGGVIEAIFAVVIGILIVISVPELKVYFDKLVGAVFTGIILGIIVAVIIFVVWIIMNKEQSSYLV